MARRGVSRRGLLGLFAGAAAAPLIGATLPEGAPWFVNATAGHTLYWVSNDGHVYRMEGEVPHSISEV